MRNIQVRLARLTQKIYRLLYQRVIIILVMLLGLGFGVGLVGTYWLSTNLVDSQAMHYAKVAVATLNEARQLYSQNVVGRVTSIEGVSVSAEYEHVNGGIPNPATYTIELGDHLSDEMRGMLFRLYSDYPFPNRVETGGAKDKFEADALVYLKKHPNKAFFRKENYGDRLTFRYTEAIQMEASCVACHNTLANSPKKDWQVGDVRGVVEVVQPLDTVMLVAIGGLKTVYTVLAIILALAIAGIIVVVERLRNINQNLEEKVEARTIELEHIARTDCLTQLANRREFEKVLNQEWRRMQREQSPLSIILCDVDYFKRYNDTYGHQAGDNCLYTVAQVLQSYTQRVGDLAARYGGEEFVLVLPNINGDKAAAVATLIRQGIHKLGILHEASEVHKHLTLSMGIATIIPDQGLSPEQLIQQADQALYQAKEAGRDRFSTFTLMT